MLASQVLDGAADALEEYGWTQGTQFAQDGSMCAIGAVLVASGGAKRVSDRWVIRNGLVQPGYTPAVMALAGTIAFNTQSDSLLVRVPDWNDAPGRTATEVIDTLRHAAIQARAEEEANDAAA